MGALYALLIVFCSPPKNSTWYWPLAFFYHQGGLLPVMVLIIIGSALGVDPIAKYIFQCKPMLIFGRISYSQYLLQYPVYGLLQTYVGHGVTCQVLFPFVLITMAFLTERFVGRTYTEAQRVSQQNGVPGLDEKVIEKIELCMGSVADWSQCRGRHVQSSP